MSGLDHLRSLAEGRLPADDGLLGNTRCAWGGADLLGDEAILAAFTAHPFSVDDARAVETAQGAALVAADRALVADLYDGRIGRLWRIGGSSPDAADPAVDVAFDPDMRQQRGDLALCREDHPELTPDAAEAIEAAAREMLEAQRRDCNLRSRGFVLRAFGDVSGSAALIALYTMTDEPQRRAGFRFAAIGLGGRDDQPLIAIEPARATLWSPRL